MKRDPPILSIMEVEWIIVRICLQQILLTALSECSIQCLLSSTLSPAGVCNENDASTEKVVKLVSDITLKMASANDIIFHFDNSTSTLVDAICAQIGLNNSTISDDKNNIHRTNKFHYSALSVVYILNRYGGEHSKNGSLAYFKPSRNILHVVILPNSLIFADHNLVNIKSDHIILYICVNQSQNVRSCRNQFEKRESNFENPSMFLNTTLIKNMYLVMVLEFTDKLVKLFEICYYCGYDSQKMTLRYESELSHENALKSSLLINQILKEVEYNFKDFNSHSLRVGFPHNYIYVGCVNEVNTEVGDDVFTECSDFTGVEAIMVREMSRRLNFKYALVNPKKHAEEGTWRNMVMDVYNLKVDFAIASISVSEARLKILDFSDKVGDDPLRVIYMSRSNVLSEALMIVLVFEFQTWGTLIATMSFLSCLIYLSDRYCYTNHLALFRCFWMVGCILIEQGIGSCSKMPGRCVLGSWLLCTIILCTVYKGKLTSDMVNPPTEHLANLREMGELGYHVYVHEFDGSLIVDALNKSLDPVLQEMSKRTHRNLSICKVLRKALHTDIVLIEEEILVQNAVNYKCSEIMSNEDLSKIRVTNDLNFPSAHAWPFSKNTPYIGVINYYISLFYQNGLQAKWSESLHASSGKNNIDFDKGIVKSDSSQNPIKLYGPLLMWAFGILISIICFVSELCYSVCLNSKRNVDLYHALHKH